MPKISKSTLKQRVASLLKRQTSPRTRPGGDFQQIVKVPRSIRPVRPECSPGLIGIHPGTGSSCKGGTKAAGPYEQHVLQSLSISAGSCPPASSSWTWEAPDAGTGLVFKLPKDLVINGIFEASIEDVG